MTHLAPETVSIEQEAGSRSDVSCGGYDPVFFDRLARVEDQHFWFRARNRLIFKLAKRITSEWQPGYVVLEVGCGTGNVLRMLHKACPEGVVIGLELWLEGLRHAQKRSASMLVQGDVRDFPFSRPLNLVGMFDVLEHVQEERETLTSIWRSLLPGGVLLLTVPAHQFLWSYFDEAAHHCRRYSVLDIREKLTAAGFQVEFVSQFMASIFPLLWMIRKMRRRRNQADPSTVLTQASDEFRLVPIVNHVLTVLLNLEADWLARGHRLPFGTSLVVVARRM